MDIQLDKYVKIINDEFKDNLEFKYQIPFKDSGLYKIYIKNIKEQIVNEYPIDPVYFSWLLDLSILHFEYSNYAIIKLENELLAKKHLSLSNAYGYLCLEYGNKSCGCFETKNPFIIMNKASFIMSNLLLSNEIDKFNSIGKHLISSLNGEGCIIKKGYAKATISWFIIEKISPYPWVVCNKNKESA
ncbi:hypothetical protein JHD50_04065 [Sulfurimonas sp. MAG313]|nr:hypothetical protein [Sulfurimonas sp. MAG313]MDF1880486.1 hypothetical protein [Sulfurimonas sp. MAG313]